MAFQTDIPRVALQVSQDLLVASIQVNLDDEVLTAFEADLLGRLQATGCRGVILDLSGLETLDSTEFAALCKIASMVHIMGSAPVIAGVRPGVASALIDAGADVAGLNTAIDLDAAFELLLSELADPVEGETEIDADEPSEDIDE